MNSRQISSPEYFQEMVTCPRIRSMAMDFDYRTRIYLRGPLIVKCEDKIDRLKSAVLTPNLPGRFMLAITAKGVYLLRRLGLWCILVSSAVECLFVLVLGLKSLLM
ncbi:uncharacterized protein LOC112026975 isoform X2 [Quercus suber]|uniref:uncharacterized protein LOC112026975 isoform X2 n=1 Tax=Quercus suber TaxID=58331 RepID=UPI0032E01A70